MLHTKATKENVRIAPIILFFLKNIVDQLIIKGGITKDTTILVKSKDIKYCYDAIRMVEKTFKRKNITCKMSSYLNHIEDKTHMYVWKIKRDEILTK